ncbi:hypothetical protein GJ744_009211 [Endocarpon pusillum]|uniref:N-acetyltransferase domain-containing protein n=1 Tax=Endocarpon pusillum TaxID=364733 RepID=A0A8H7E537_9EURO|nr:hypothetical protein GJ744_009211 [Endocarpon pusillum]
MIPDTPAIEEWWKESHQNALLDPRTRFAKVTDEDTAEVVAMVRWVLPRDNESPQPGPEKRRWPEFPDDVDRSLADPLFESVALARKEIMEDRRHYVLEFIQTAKEYKGRGAASLVMRYGCDMADNDGLEIYVSASMEGYPMFLKYGFVLKGEDTMPGGYGFIQRHLVRPARKH